MARLHSPKLYPHGDNRRYVFNRCRCDECGAAHTQAARDRRRAIAYGRHRGYINAVGTVRRLRALVAIGWSGRHLAAILDVDPSWIRALYRGDHKQVHEDTADLFAELYRRYETQPGPSDLARRMATRRDWPGPGAWDETTIDDPEAEPYGEPAAVHVDAVSVDLALAGKPAALTTVERHHAVHAGRNRGMGTMEIASALRMSASRVKELGAKPLPEGCEVAA